MIVPLSEWPEGPFGRVVADEYSALNWVYEIAQYFNHVEAVDASVDAIRQLLIDGADLSLTPKVLKSSPSESSLNQMLMDFVVYGGLDKDYTALIDSRIAPIESFDGLTRRDIQSARARQPLDDYLRITNELCKMFNRKAEDAIAGRPLPDLMERCRYHSHGENNRACYLETAKPSLLARIRVLLELQNHSKCGPWMSRRSVKCKHRSRCRKELLGSGDWTC